MQFFLHLPMIVPLKPYSGFGPAPDREERHEVGRGVIAEKATVQDCLNDA